MYTHQFSSSKANSEAAQKPNGGTVVNGGNIAGSAFVAQGRTLLGAHSGVHGAVVATGGSTGTQKANSSGTLAKMTVGAYVMMRVTTTLAGISNTCLLTGAGDFGRNSINYVRYLRGGTVKTMSWTTGTKDLPVYTVTYGNVATVDLSAGDDAAHPTRAIPGEFTVKQTGAAPVNKDYPAKTG